ncbi:uncharacterized protein LOC100679713 [Nasonia vitripennis]|uniref:Uncharacterized protein n=1 Tax=Nasonia vitripennis TaxID=7425 RepID=A0A7M7QKX2_NASVI|nr:uncharacterized protein LOC100679713 [Nasonia vitripennis]
MHQFQTFVLECISHYEKAREGHALQEKEKRNSISETGEMYLGENITIDRIKWDLLLVEKPLYFFGGLAIHLWGGPRQLANRALDISKVKENIPGRSPIAVIEANLLRLQISLYLDFLKRDKTLTNVERAKLLSESINNMRYKIRDLRTKEKKWQTETFRETLMQHRGKNALQFQD